MAITLTAVVFLLIGAALGAGGVWLAVLGGSWYYILAGLAFLITSYLLFRKRASALLVYAVLVIGTLGWAIWEIGFDWWQLAPRGGVIILLGLWLLTPWIRRGLNARHWRTAHFVGAGRSAASQRPRRTCCCRLLHDGGSEADHGRTQQGGYRNRA